jgi:hypothetical protein
MTAAAETNLLFNWGPPRPRALALILFISISLLLHALCFYVFQVVYSPSVALVPPPARVNLISDKTEDGRAFLRWIDAEDPALSATTLRARERDLPRLEHVPSYKTARAALKPLPPLVVDLTPPSAFPPGPAPTTERAAPARVAPVATSVEFSEEIAARGAAKFPATKFEATTNEQAQNVRFRIAVNARGEVQYAFPVNSSGDAALDTQARQHIAQTRFPNSPNEALTWGIATVEFGGDVARPGESVDSRTRSTSTPAESASP